MELGLGEGAAPSAEMEALLAAIDRFCERPKDGRADGEVAAELIHLRHGCDRLELEFSDSAAVFATTDVFDRQGSTSPIDWIRHNCHLTGPAAAARVDVGNNLDRLPQSVVALEAREIGFAHLTAMARTADVLYNSETAAGFDEAALLVKARENSPGKFYYICRHARHAADPNGYAGEQAEQVENRSLSLSMWEDGTYAISGVLDTVGGAALRSAQGRPRPPRPQAADGRRPGRVRGARPTGTPPGHDLARDLARSERGAGGGDGLLAADFIADGGASGLRLQPDQDPARFRFDGDRRRALEADGRRAAADGTRGSRPALPLAGLRPAGEMERRSSCRALDSWRGHRSRQPRPALSSPPLDGSRRQVAAGACRGRTDAGHPAHDQLRGVRSGTELRCGGVNHRPGWNRLSITRHVWAAERAQLNSAARKRPRRRRSAATDESPSNFSRAARHASGSSAGITIPASWTSSGRLARFETTTGVPHAIASRGGSPNPSYQAGCASTRARL